MLAIIGLGVIPLGVAAGMAWWKAVGLAAAIMVFTAITLALTMLLLWRPWARRFPAGPRGADAEVRLFQFVSLGALGGFNGCVEIASDASQVRLELMPPFGWCFGSPIGLPRREMVLVRRAGIMDAAVVRIGERTVTLPGWTVPELG